MTNVYEFMSGSPYLTFFLALLLMQTVVFPLRLVSRWIGHKNIKEKGWPPSHLDSVGNPKN